MTAWFTLIDLYLTSTWHVFLFHSSGPCLWENINLYLKQPAALDPSSFNFELYVGQFFSSQYSHSKFYFYNPPASADRLYSIHLLSVTVSPTHFPKWVGKHNSITTCTQCGARLVITRLLLLIADTSTHSSGYFLSWTRRAVKHWKTEADWWYNLELLLSKTKSKIMETW